MTQPGAMTAAMRAVRGPEPSAPKVLRAGVVHRGRIVQERIVHRRETVSVGTSETNHFVVAAPGMPSRFALFEPAGERWALNFTSAMAGRMGTAGDVRDLAELRRSGRARETDGGWQVELPEDAKGKVVLGEVTLLFQLVAAPPVMPRPQLPAAARGGFAKGIDWLFTAFVVFSYVGLFGLIVYLENADGPIEEDIHARLERAADLVFAEPPPPPSRKSGDAKAPEPDEETQREQDAEPQDDPQRDSSKRTTDRPEDPPPVSPEAEARIGEEAAARAQSLMLGAFAESGSIDNLLEGGAPTGNAQVLLADVSGVEMASAGGDEMRPRGGGGTGETGDLGTLATAGGGGGQPIDTGEVVEEEVVGIVTPKHGLPTGGTGRFDANKVADAIRARQRILQTCYENEVLHRDPTAGGKVEVTFTIEQRGTVSGIEVTRSSGNDPLDGCVTRVVRTLRFTPGPQGGSIDFSYPFVFAPQG